MLYINITSVCAVCAFTLYSFAHSLHEHTRFAKMTRHPSRTKLVPLYTIDPHTNTHGCVRVVVYSRTHASCMCVFVANGVQSYARIVYSRTQA